MHINWSIYPSPPVVEGAYIYIYVNMYIYNTTVIYSIYSVFIYLFIVFFEGCTHKYIYIIIIVMIIMIIVMIIIIMIIIIVIMHTLIV